MFLVVHAADDDDLSGAVEHDLTMGMVIVQYK